MNCLMIVLVLQTSTIVAGVQMVIRDGHGFTGEVIASASVGQKISLDVIMQNTGIYDLYVHDCFARDPSHSMKQEIVDQHGCAIGLDRAVDEPVLTNAPIYGGPKHVYVHMYGFQLTPGNSVRFQCLVNQCLQPCNPQQCSGFQQNSLSPETITVSRSLKINPTNNVNAAGGDSALDYQSAGGGKICIARSIAILIPFLFLLACGILLLIAAFFYYRSQRKVRDQIKYFTPASSFIDSSAVPKNPAVPKRDMVSLNQRDY